MLARGFVTCGRLEGTIGLQMNFRTHLGRPFDFRHWSNLVLLGLVLVTAIAAAVLWLNGEPGAIAMTPVYAFLVWGVLREIDPDHDWTALVAAAVTAVWSLSGGPITSALALAGLMVAARIITSTTGRRPLLTDLAAVSVFGIVMGFSLEGWVAGFGIALAIYLDDRLSGDNRLPAIGASVLTAIGTTVVANLIGAFPERLPDIIPGVAAAAGVAALALLVREPAEPISQVDARHAAFMDPVRLHMSRSVVGILVFAMAVLGGLESEGLIVIIGALGLAVVANEIELIRRRNL